MLGSETSSYLYHYSLYLFIYGLERRNKFCLHTYPTELFSVIPCPLGGCSDHSPLVDEDGKSQTSPLLLTSAPMGEGPTGCNAPAY